MPDHGDESGRMLGFPAGRPARQNRPEPQRVLGFSQEMFANIDVEFFRGFLHPVKSVRRWSRRRRLGAYAVDDDTPSRRR